MTTAVYPTDGRATFMQSRAAGYRTHGVGKCHFPSRAGEDWGFDSRDVQEELARIENDDYLQHLVAEGFEHVIDPHGVRGRCIISLRSVSCPSDSTHAVGLPIVVWISSPRPVGQIRPGIVIQVSSIRIRLLLPLVHGINYIGHR